MSKKKQNDNGNNSKVKKGVIVCNGVVTEALPNAMFRVTLDNGYETLCTISGKMRMNFIRVLPDDKVQVEFGEYGFDRGRIVFRNKN